MRELKVEAKYKDAPRESSICRQNVDASTRELDFQTKREDIHDMPHESSLSRRSVKMFYTRATKKKLKTKSKKIVPRLNMPV